MSGQVSPKFPSPLKCNFLVNFKAFSALTHNLCVLLTGRMSLYVLLGTRKLPAQSPKWFKIVLHFRLPNALFQRSLRHFLLLTLNIHVLITSHMSQQVALVTSKLPVTSLEWLRHCFVFLPPSNAFFQLSLKHFQL